MTSERIAILVQQHWELELVTYTLLVCPEWGPGPGTPRRDPDVLGVGAGRG